jgi:hypothetical protein
LAAIIVVLAFYLPLAKSQLLLLFYCSSRIAYPYHTLTVLGIWERMPKCAPGDANISDQTPWPSCWLPSKKARLDALRIKTYTMRQSQIFLTKQYHLGISICLALAIIFLLSPTNGNAQMKDTTKKFENKHPNIVKVSISQWILYPSSFHMAYERVLSHNKSIDIFGGYNLFPLDFTLNFPGVEFQHSSSRTGYSIGGEFRFYLSKENKYDAPHGVFLAPFISYYNFGGNRGISHTDSLGATEMANLVTKTTFFSVGGELGYQFLLWKRLAIDCELIGPSFTYYTFQARIDGSITGIDESSLIYQALQAIVQKIPLLSDFANGKQVNASGFTNQRFPAVGFRYAIFIGFRF